MNAVISGTARQALLIDGESLKSLGVEDPSRLVVRRQADLPYMFGEGRDLRFIQNSDLHSIIRELKSDSDFSVALDLTLISLDEELEEDIRKDAINDLDELLAEPQLRERLECIMYARPLPDDGDLPGALKFCDKSGSPHSFALFKDLEARQPFISKVSAAWDGIPTNAFGGHEQRSEFERVAAQRGLFRLLVIILETSAPISQFFLAAAVDGAIQHLRNHRQILQMWSGPFRESGEILAMTPDASDEQVQRETRPRRKRGRRVGINRAAVLQEVNKRKSKISNAIQRRDFQLLWDLVDDLVSFQRNSGETEHLAKSLCDIAMEAKEIGLVHLQLALTERTIGEVPDDAWSWSQYGDSLLKMGRFSEALNAFQQSEAFGEEAIAKTGRAEVLKAQGRLSDALTAFDEVIAQHPEDAVAKTGRAEVLKAQGRLSDALSAFDEVITQHPENAVAKTGRAEVLKAQGRLSDALSAFDEVIRQHPEHVVAKNGRAEVLKAQGRLSDALAAFDEVTTQHPEDVFSKTGRAEVLKARGRLSDALAAFDKVITQHPENAVAKTGRAEVLKAQGRLGDALAAFDEVITQHPESVFAKTGRAEVLKAQGRLGDALAAFDEVITQHPENAVAKTGRAEVLKAQGRLGDALAAFDEVITQHPENAVAKTGRAEVLKTQGRLSDALAAFDEVITQHPENVVAKNGRAEVLKAQGRLSDALAAFDEVITQHPEHVVAKNGRAEVLKAQGRLSDALAAFDEAITQHPESVFAKTGRAEVLKAQGRLEDALAAYDEVAARYPNSAVARNGRSCILAALGRFEPALEVLPPGDPVALEDWIAFHIRGVLLMRMKRVNEAVQVFQRGVKEVPFHSSVAYFQTALAVALIKQQKYGDAKGLLSEINSPSLKPQVDALRLHVSGEDGQFEEATSAFEDLTPKPWSISDELLDELHRRYILRSPPKHSDDWVFDQEVGSLLVVANQQASMPYVY